MSDSEQENIEIDHVTGVETTGHEWDGIKELNNPMPRWWLWTFYACIIWAFGYVIAYPAIPLINGATPGLLGYSSRGALADSVALAAEDQLEFVEQIASTDVGDILGNNDLEIFARAGGASTFKVYCSQCHGTGAQGASGFPNLLDDEWIWGGTINEIYTTISHGVRYDPDLDTRFNEMPRFGTDDILESEDVRSVSRYVAFLGGLEGGENSAHGATLFADNCESCHGAMGIGDAEQGGPALDNAIWLYSGDYESIVTQVSAPRHGVMPAWSNRLDDTTIKQLAVYVYSLGGGQ